MGFTPYSEPVHVDVFQLLMHLKPGGGFEIDLSYLRHHAEEMSMTQGDGGPTMGLPYTKKLETLLGLAHHSRNPWSHGMRRLWSCCRWSSRRRLSRAQCAALEDPDPRLCLASGYAMNSVRNGTIRE
jgi:carbamoyltransferase